MSLSTIAFDADDTLWENEKFFRLTEQRFHDLLSDYLPSQSVSQKLLETEKKNLRFYGYGIKGFTLSMMETAIEITGGEVPAYILQEILNAGREMLEHPVLPINHAEDALKFLAGDYRIILITKGDLFDQERKLAQSGLGDYFDAVEIVSEKTTETYYRIFEQYGDGLERSMMIGNSLRSDIIPALNSGAWSVFVPHELTWALEHAEIPEEHLRFRQLSDLSQLPKLVKSL